MRVKQVREHFSESFAISLFLTGADRHEILAGQIRAEEKTIPGSIGWRDDSFVANRAYFNLLDAIRKAQIDWQTHGLRSIVCEDCAGAHGLIPGFRLGLTQR